MNRHFIANFIVLALFSVFAKGQDIKMTELVPVTMEVSYELNQLCDYPNQWNAKGWHEKSTLILEIGNGMAHSYVVEEHRSTMNQLITQRDKNHWNIEAFNLHALLGETFMGYPGTDELTQVVNLDAAGVFQYTESIPKQEWEISTGSKTIMGYNCQRATMEFRGRKYEAWFTTDIPLSYGPWKFHGLPGLILEVTDSKNEYRFTANGIRQVNGERNIMMFGEKIRKIKRSRALKMEAMLHKDHGAYAADYGILFRLEGMEHNALPYYPLELE